VHLEIAINVAEMNLPIRPACHPDIASVNQLAPEVLYCIFDYFSAPTAANSADAIRLSHVTRYWRNVSISYPPLWSNIFIGTAHSSLHKEFLVRARCVPLTVIVDLGRSKRVSDIDISESISSLATYANRIKSLHIDISDLSPQGRLDRILKRVSVFPMPNLQCLHYEYKSVLFRPTELSSLPIFGLHFPRLTDLSIRAFVGWSPRLFTGLIHTTFDSMWGGMKISFLLDFFEHNPLLQSFELHRTVLYPENRTHTVTLRDMKHLVFNGCPSQVVLRHLSLPATVELQIDERNVNIFPPDHSKLRFLHDTVRLILLSNKRDFSLEGYNSEGGSFTLRHCLYGIQDFRPISLSQVTELVVMEGDETRGSGLIPWISNPLGLSLGIPAALVSGLSSLKTLQIMHYGWDRVLNALLPRSGEPLIFASLEGIEIAIQNSNCTAIFERMLQVVTSRAEVGSPLHWIEARSSTEHEAEEVEGRWMMMCREHCVSHFLG
jgi:hypothetical protein